MTSFPSYESCMNDTRQCNEVGTCTATDSHNFSCICIPRFLATTNCLESVNTFYGLKDAFFFVIGILLSVYLIFLVVPDIISETQRRLFTTFYWGKLAILLAILSKAIYFFMWAYDSFTKTLLHPYIELGILSLSNIIAVVAFLFILISWIGLYNRVVNLSFEDSPYFQFIKMLLIFCLFLYSCTTLALLVLLTFPAFHTTATLALFIVTFVLLTILIFWSTLHAIKIHFYFQTIPLDSNQAVFLHKNKLLLLMNLIALLYVGLWIGNYVIETKQNPWIFLLLHSLLRLIEFILYFFIILILKKHDSSQSLKNQFKDWNYVLMKGSSDTKKRSTSAYKRSSEVNLLPISE